jgi:hypothetical protein
MGHFEFVKLPTGVTLDVTKFWSRSFLIGEGSENRPFQI